MFWSLLTAFVAAFAGAGVGMALRHLTRQRLPKGIVPVSAGVAMLAATVATEYGWAPNVIDTMPDDLVVISERRQQAWYQPWTYVRPWVRGFIAYSPSETVETAVGSGVLVVQTTLQERWQPAIVKPILVDCAMNRRAEIEADTEFNDAGEPTNVEWLVTETDDPILTSVCDGETAAS